MPLKGKRPQVEDEESRAMRRMLAFDQSDSDLDQADSHDNDSEQVSDEDDLSDTASEQDEDEEDEDDEAEEAEDDSDDDSEDSEDSDASDDSDDSDDDDKKLRELQNNLSQIPFDKLAEIQQKVGMKAFHQTLRGSERKKTPSTKGPQRKSQAYDNDSEDDDEDDSEDDSDSADGHDRKTTTKAKLDKLRETMDKERKQRKMVEKRSDKNRPMEIGSKKPVGRFRQVVEVASTKRRDPRFDSLSGKLDSDLFEKSYSFLKDYQADEMKKLKELIKKERDPDMKEKLQTQLSRMVDRQATEATQKRRQEIKREHKRKERELISKGKNPFFLKKSDQKKLELIDKFQNLKDNPKALARAMEKRRKRNSAKEKTKILGAKRRRVD
ncbi:rRNA biogenesis protein rrp36 [Mortierella claussenii]|nr:rRNA biogenesis protein rrp36 [Mortierella claussenii]